MAEAKAKAATKTTVKAADKAVETKVEAKEEKKTPVKATTKTTGVKKAPVKKVTATAKAEDAKAVVNFQFAGKSYTTDDLVKIAKDVWVYDLNKDLKDFKSVELYVKPEESTAYYVVNEEVTGSFGI